MLFSPPISHCMLCVINEVKVAAIMVMYELFRQPSLMAELQNCYHNVKNRKYTHSFYVNSTSLVNKLFFRKLNIFILNQFNMETYRMSF